MVAENVEVWRLYMMPGNLPNGSTTEAVTNPGPRPDRQMGARSPFGRAYVPDP
jgi:hypothetical protein